MTYVKKIGKEGEVISLSLFGMKSLEFRRD